jgi:hypothetical protein
MPASKNLFRYFTETTVPNIHFPEKRFYTTTDPVMTPELIEHFFNVRTRVFAGLRMGELLLLHSIYDLPEYKRCLPLVPDDTPRSEMRRRTHIRFSGAIGAQAAGRRQWRSLDRAGCVGPQSDEGHRSSPWLA